MLPLAFAAPWAGYIVLDLHALLRHGAYENRAGRALKLLSVTLLTALVWTGEAADLWLRLAFLFILAGDLAFSLLGRFVLGVSLFGVAQALLTVRHLPWAHEGHPTVSLAVCAILGAAVFAALYPGVRRRGLALPVGAYIAAMVVSVGISTAGLGVSPMASRAAIGMALFAACDVCVGARVATHGAWRERVGVLAWVFYLPGLVGLAGSAAGW